jgi:general nucleoside transport system ATP-binding protein
VSRSTGTPLFKSSEVMDLELKHIHKRFGSIHANDDISLQLHGGRIVGLLGENGAGKSTLMKILSGFQSADSGEIWIDGRHVDYEGPLPAIRHGIGMLQQDPLVINAFNVLENFTYGQRGGLFLGRARAIARLEEYCRRCGFELDPETPISQLSIAQRQQLEIVRLLALGIKVLILDEPTTGISTDQKTMLFDTLRNLAREDGMTIILVSHKLEDVIALCDEVVVLRGGKLVGDVAMPVSKSELVTMMFGQELAPQTLERIELNHSTPSLELVDVHLQAGRLVMEGINFQVCPGEVIGLAGLDGSGQELLMRVCAGLARCQHGQVLLGGRDMTKATYQQFLRAGVVFSAAGRLEEGLISGLTLTEHMALVTQNGLFVNWDRARRYTEQQVALYNVRGRPHDRVETLSGGNQQRVLIAMLPERPAVLVLEQPTRGLDVDSARWIWEQLLARREHGTAIIFSSADLDELMTYSDRLVVCYAGRTMVIDDPSTLTVSALGHLIGGEFEEYDL